MTSRIRHLEHALAVSQAQLASNAQSPGYSIARTGPLESGFKPATLDNVFNPATCTSSSVSLSHTPHTFLLFLPPTHPPTHPHPQAQQRGFEHGQIRRQTILSQLPGESEALNLVERYYQNFGWV